MNLMFSDMHLMFWAVMPHCWASGSLYSSGAQCLHLLEKFFFLTLKSQEHHMQQCSATSQHNSINCTTVETSTLNHYNVHKTPPIALSTSWLIQNSTTTQINVADVQNLTSQQRHKYHSNPLQQHASPQAASTFLMWFHYHHNRDHIFQHWSLDHLGHRSVSVNCSQLARYINTVHP